MLRTVFIKSLLPLNDYLPLRSFALIASPRVKMCIIRNRALSSSDEINLIGVVVAFVCSVIAIVIAAATWKVTCRSQQPNDIESHGCCLQPCRRKKVALGAGPSGKPRSANPKMEFTISHMAPTPQSKCRQRFKFRVVHFPPSDLSSPENSPESPTMEPNPDPP